MVTHCYLIRGSRSTLYRQLEEEEIATEVRYLNITDNELDRIIMEIKRDHPNDGERMIVGHSVNSTEFCYSKSSNTSINPPC